MIHKIAISVVTLGCASLCFAGVEKIAVPSEQGFQLYWWPKVDPGPPWHFNQPVSYQNAVKMFLPEGSTLANAETVMYAKANYKPRVPETKTLKELIDQDIASFKAHDASLKIEVASPLVDGDGNKLQVLSFTPSSKGNWELTAYGEESDYFLVFTVSSRSKQGLESAHPAFKTMISSYHQAP